MKNAKRNIIVSAFMAIALCMSVVAGATFALFTSNSSVNIAITSGNVEVTATASDLTVYSPTSVNEDGIVNADNAVDKNGGRFVNGGTATLTGSELKLDNMTPGDKVNFNIKVENKSTVTVKYRTRIYCGEDNGLYAGLKYSITNGTETYESMAITDWATLTPDVKEVANLACEVELPVDAGNEYKNKSCKLVYQVEAVQGNAETANDIRYYTLAQFNALTEIPAEVKNVYVHLGNATVKYGKTLTIGKTEIGDTFAYMDVNGNASTGNSTNIKYYNSKAEAEAAEIPEGYRVNCIRPAGGEGADGGPRYTIILETAKKGVNLYLSGKITVIDTPAINELKMGYGADVSICVPGNSVVIADGLQVNGLCKIWTKHESGFISAVFSHKVPELVMKNCEINGCWLQDGLTVEKATFENCTFDTINYKNVRNSNPIWWRMTTKSEIRFTNCTFKSILPIKFETPRVTPILEITNCNFDIAKSAIYADDTRNYGVIFSSQDAEVKFGDVMLTGNKLFNETAGLVSFYDAKVGWKEGCHLIMNDNDVKGGIVQMYKTAATVEKTSYMKGNDFKR